MKVQRKERADCTCRSHHLENNGDGRKNNGVEEMMRAFIFLLFISVHTIGIHGYATIDKDYLLFFLVVAFFFWLLGNNVNDGEIKGSQV